MYVAARLDGLFTPRSQPLETSASTAGTAAARIPVNEQKLSSSHPIDEASF
jgi:hypothetical protein